MDKLGIEPTQLFFQAINFTIMVVVLTKLLYNPILRALNERKRKIAEGLAYTEKMKKEEEKLEKKRQEVVDKAKDEARKIIEEGKEAGNKLKEDIVKKAHAEAQDIIEKGKKDIELERVEMEQKLRDETIEVAEAMVTRLLENILTEKNQKALIEKKLAQIAKDTK